MTSHTHMHHAHGVGTAGCQRAAHPDCVCACHGLLHQSDLLRCAVDPAPPLGRSAFQGRLTEALGSAFTGLTTAPAPHERSRRGWNSTAKLQASKSQIEQRIVDVTLRDLLSSVYEIPASRKEGWLPYVDRMTTGAWSNLAQTLGSPPRGAKRFRQ